MSAPNTRWEWPIKVARLLPEPCDGYACLLDKPRRDIRQVGDVERCHWHNRLIVVRSIKASSDTNGVTYFTKFKRLHWWRLAYWRTRRHATDSYRTTEGADHE